MDAGSWFCPSFEDLEGFVFLLSCFFVVLVFAAVVALGLFVAHLF